MKRLRDRTFVVLLTSISCVVGVAVSSTGETPYSSTKAESTTGLSDEQIVGIFNRVADVLKVDVPEKDLRVKNESFMKRRGFGEKAAKQISTPGLDVTVDAANGDILHISRTDLESKGIEKGELFFKQGLKFDFPPKEELLVLAKEYGQAAQEYLKLLNLGIGHRFRVSEMHFNLDADVWVYFNKVVDGKEVRNDGLTVHLDQSNRSLLGFKDNSLPSGYCTTVKITPEEAMTAARSCWRTYGRGLVGLAWSPLKFHDPVLMVGFPVSDSSRDPVPPEDISSCRLVYAVQVDYDYVVIGKYGGGPNDPWDIWIDAATGKAIGKIHSQLCSCDFKSPVSRTVELPLSADGKE